jgi:hypothetical protein
MKNAGSMTKSRQWFTVDERGLAAHVEAQGRGRVLRELLQNAWDTEAEHVTVTMTRLQGSQFVHLRVQDDDPTGYEDLDLAFTLFGRSSKRADPDRRGRFCSGEKLALSVCRSASVQTTSGRVEFTEEGTRVVNRRLCVSRGTTVDCDLRLTREEQREIEEAFFSLIPPAGKVTTFNGQALERPAPVAETTVSLPTVVEEGEVLRERTRATIVRLHEPLLGESPHLYEMGIPVCEIPCRWHLDVQQRVPLGQDRDSVKPAYLAKVQAAALEAGAARLSSKDAGEAWVTGVLGHALVGDEAVRRVVEERFGRDSVAADPSDREATQQATAEGYRVVHGGSLPPDAWSAVRRAGALKPAGQVFPTPKPYSTDPRATPVDVVPCEQWTEGMKQLAELTQWLCARLGVLNELVVRYVRPHGQNSCSWSAAWGGGALDYNLSALGWAWPDQWWKRFPAVIDLMLHEFAHRWAESHLDQNFHAACTRLAGRLLELLLLEPESVPHLYLVTRGPNETRQPGA